MSIRQFSTLAALVGMTNAAGSGYDYFTNNGRNWPDLELTNDDGSAKVNQCGEPNQSPIALYFEGHGSFTYEIKDAKDDAVTKNYANQKTVPVAELADTTKVTLNTYKDGTGAVANHYTSNFAQSVFGVTKNKWDALQFHMHSPSEHTYNGEYYDLEMHTVHVPDGMTEPGDGGNGFIASAMGLVFSADSTKVTADLTFAQQQVIDIFFDSMKWDVTGSPTADLVAYGSLMEMADFNNRWVYKGSVTTPPCNINVYWNVLSTVYPIQQRHVDLFKDKLEAGTPGLKAQGNFREVQPINGQDVFYVKSIAPSVAEQVTEELTDLAKNPTAEGKGLVAATVIFAIIAFFALIGCAVFGYQANSKPEGGAKAEGVQMQEAPAAAPKDGEE